MRVLVGVVAASLILTMSDGVAAGPKGTPELALVVSYGRLAVDTDCNFYRRLEDPRRYEFVTQGPAGRPTSIVEDGVGTSRYKLGMANGDIYHVVSGAAGVSFTFEANVFGGLVSASSQSWSAVKRELGGATQR